MNEKAEFNFTFTDIFNDFARQHAITGSGFTALYHNFLETQASQEAIKAVQNQKVRVQGGYRLERDRQPRVGSRWGSVQQLTMTDGG